MLCFHTNPPALLKYPLLAVQCLKFLEADSAEMRTSQLYQQSPAQRTVLNTNTKTQIQMYTIHTYIQIRVYTIIQKQMYELHTNTEIHMHTMCKTHGNTHNLLKYIKIQTAYMFGIYQGAHRRPTGETIELFSLNTIWFRLAIFLSDMYCYISL